MGAKFVDSKYESSKIGLYCEKERLKDDEKEKGMKEKNVRERMGRKKVLNK